MGIKQNPFGVGYSGPSRIEAVCVCTCCGIEFLWKGTRDTQAWDSQCHHCIDHSSETQDTELTMLREHQKRLVEAVDRAHQLARDANHDARTKADAAAEYRRRTAAALRSRDKHREIVAGIQDEHPPAEPGHCGCLRSQCTASGLITEIRTELR